MPSLSKDEADALPLLAEANAREQGPTTPQTPASASWAPRAAIATTVLMVGGTLAVAAWSQSSSASAGGAASPDFHLVTSGNVNFEPAAAHVEPVDYASSDFKPARGSSGAGDNDDGHEKMPGDSKTTTTTTSSSSSDPASVDHHHWDVWTTNGDGYGDVASLPTEEAAVKTGDPASVDTHHWDVWTTNGDGYGDVESIPSEGGETLDVTNDQKQKSKRASKTNKKDNIKNNGSGEHHKTSKGSDASSDAGTSDSSNTEAADGSAEGRQSDMGSDDIPDKGPPDGSEGVGMPGKGLDASDDQPSLPTGPGGGVADLAEADSTVTPNVVFVLFDDVGYNDFGYSSTDLKAATPTITKLGKEGVILSRYYTEPDCTPAR